MAGLPPPPPLVVTNPNVYPGLFNSNYKAGPTEGKYINNPVAFLGPWMLAACLCMLLEGVILSQVVSYFRTYHRSDRVGVKYLAYIVVLFCSAKAGHLVYIAWTFFVSEFGNYLRASIPTSSIKLTAFQSALTGALVQGFFIHRTFVLSRSWIFLVLTVPTLILGLVGSLILTILVFNIPLMIKSGPLLNASANMMVSCVVICDIFITGFTTHYLLKTKTGFVETNHLISRVLQTALKAAAPPTMCAIVNLGLNFQAAKYAWVNLFNSLMPFLYAISMLYTLNARKHIRGASNIISSSSNGYELRSAQKSTMGVRGFARPEVYVSHQTHIDGTSTTSKGIAQAVDSKHNVSLQDGDDDGSIKYKMSNV